VRSEAEVGGQPDVPVTMRPADFDKNKDGMADEWERAHGLNLDDPADANRASSEGGVTNIENYLNSLVP
jgi:hypothetical protein